MTGASLRILLGFSSDRTCACICPTDMSDHATTAQWRSSQFVTRWRFDDAIACKARKDWSVRIGFQGFDWLGKNCIICAFSSQFAVISPKRDVIGWTICTYHVTVQWKNATIFMTKTFDIQTTFTLLKVVQNGAETSQCTVTVSSWAIVRTRDRDKRWTPMRVRAYHACVTKLRARKHSKAWRQSQFGQTSACLAEKLTRWKINVANELENTGWKASNSVVFG